MEEYVSSILGKGKKKLLFEIVKKESKKIKTCEKITRVDEQAQSVQSPGRARALQEKEMYLPKLGKLPAISEEYWCHAINNPSEKTI